MDELTPISKRVKSCRKALNLSQAQLGEVLGMHQQTISAYETGRLEPGAFSLLCLADALHVSIDYLLGRTKNPEINL